MATSYEDMLEQYCAKFDPFPWIEVTNGVLPAGSPVGAQTPLAMQRPYELLWDKMPFSAWDITLPGTVSKGGAPPFQDMSTGGGLYNWWIGANTDKFQQIQQAILAEDVIGSFNDRWLTIPGGSKLSKNQLWQAQWFVGAAYNGGAGLNNAGQIWQSLRGYRWLPKGKMDPPQMSRREVLKKNLWHLRSFSYAGTVTVNINNSPSMPASFQLTLNAPHGLHADFLIHRIRIRPQTPILPPLDPLYPAAGHPNPYVASEAGAAAYIYAIQVGLQLAETQAQLQGGQLAGGATTNLAPWPHFMGVDYSAYLTGLNVTTNISTATPIPKLDTQWMLARPLRIKNNDSINLIAQPPQLPAAFALNYTCTMEYILDGELMIPK